MLADEAAGKADKVPLSDNTLVWHDCFSAQLFFLKKIQFILGPDQKYTLFILTQTPIWHSS